MIKPKLLEDLIRDKIFLHEVSSGWLTFKCTLCNDYKPRAGFKFDAGYIIYNCFNCGIKSVYEELGGNLSKSFRKILNSHGIDNKEIDSVVNSSFFNKKVETSKITLASLTTVNTTTPTIQLPAKSFPLGHSEFVDYQEKLATYLIKRKVDITKYSFYFSLEKRFLNKVIIPFYRQGSLIYWQARSIESDTSRYDNAPIGRGAVLFNFDQLNLRSNLPLFITEGVFDAMMVDGVSIIGSRLGEAKVAILKKTARRIIFVIDRDKTGRSLAESVLIHGWEITFPPSGADDINHAVQRFGLSYTIYELMKNITRTGDLARLNLNLNCE